MRPSTLYSAVTAFAAAGLVTGQITTVTSDSTTVVPVSTIVESATPGTTVVVTATSITPATTTGTGTHTSTSTSTATVPATATAGASHDGPAAVMGLMGACAALGLAMM